MNGQAADVRRTLICAALSAVLYAAMQYSMGLGFISVIITPIPIAYMAVYSPPAMAIAGTGLVAGLLASYFGAMTGLEYFVQFGLGGLALGRGIRDGWSPERMVGLFAVLGLASFTGLLTLAALPQSQGFGEALKSVSGEWIAPLREAIKSENLDPRQILEAEEYIRTLEWSFLNIPFGIVTGFGIVAGWFNAMTLRRFLRARGEPLASWSNWSVPDWFIWVPIAAGFAGFFTEGAVRIAAINVMIPSVVIYFLQGLTILESLFDSWSVPGLARFFLMALVFLQIQIFGAVLAAAGAFDQWIGMRRRFAPKKGDDNA